jgi:hypothetical protein
MTIAGFQDNHKRGKCRFCPNLVVGHDVRSAAPNDSLPRHLHLQVRTLPKCGECPGLEWLLPVNNFRNNPMTAA